MKKYLIFIVVLFNVFLLNTNAANKLMQCDYNAKYGDGSRYIKYRVIYMDDGTIFQTMPQSEATEYTEGSKARFSSQVNFYPTIFLSDSNAVESAFYNALVASNFTAEAMKPYYEEKTCPHLAFSYDNNNYYILPVEDSTLHDPYGSYIWVTAPTTKLFDENEEPVEEEKPEMTTVCSYPGVTIDNVPSVNIEFQMYNNGEKYFKFYFTERGENTAQIAKVKDGTDTIINATKDNGDDYTIYLPSNEIANVFSQNSEQKKNNTFTCPNESKIWLIEEAGIQAGYYKISTNAEEAKEYSYTTDFAIRGDTDIDWNFDADSCNSILGEISDNNSPAHYLNFAFNIIKYAAIVILFVFTIIDFTKAITASKDDAIKKASQNMIKRLIIAAIIFFLPYIIIFILEILGIVTNNPTCGIGV